MILSLASQKGGTAKTTTAISIASALANQGKHILLIDMDSQANSSKVLLGDDYSTLSEHQTAFHTIINRGKLQIHKTYLPNLDIVPAHILMSDTDIKLTTAIDHREARLLEKIQEVKSQYDHILIDCPPALSWLTINAFTASERILVVISPGYFELDSTIQLRKTIDEVRDNFNPNVTLWGFLFTMADSTLASRNSLSLLRQTYTNQVFETIISKNTDIRDAHLMKQDIFTFNPKSKAAQDYLRLVKELKL